MIVLPWPLSRPHSPPLKVKFLTLPLHARYVRGLLKWMEHVPPHLYNVLIVDYV